VILGAGESGVGAALLGKQKGYDVFVSDKNKIKRKYKDVLLNNEISFEEENHNKQLIKQASIVIKSPGISDKTAIIELLKNLGITIMSEIEFASRFTEASIIGITGSNGKTTTTMLLYKLLKNAGLKVNMSGNIGDSFAKQVRKEAVDYYVLELSSFQLDDIETFKPHIAIITNITPDHLDRYQNDFNQYVEAKFRIIKNQTEEDYLIYDADDKTIENWLFKNKIKSILMPFSIEKELERGAFLKNKNIIIKTNKVQYIMERSTLVLQGKHNVKNAMAAAMAAQLLKIRKDTIRESFSDFEGVEHRLEKVLKIQGVQYINDSKATNINAVYYALECMEKPTVWIVGGVDKGNDYDELLPLVRENVKAIICLGIDNHKILETFSNVVEFIEETTSMQEAVLIANKIGEKGDNVLLSPACASFDLFENYEDRGRQFKEAVRKL